MNLILPKIITGGSLESLFYSYITETPIVLTQPYIPFELDKIDFDDGFRMLGYSSGVSLTKVQLWDRLAFILSMGGMIMMPNNIRNVREEKNKIIFSLTDNTRFTVMYERKITFDKHISSDLDVYDWFDIKSGSKVQLEHIEDDNSDVVKKIIFYNSNRRNNYGNDRKDLVSFSKIQQEDLLSFENSVSNIRLKTLRMMKSFGLKGKPNGYNKFGKQLHYAIKIEHTHREIIKKYVPKYTISEIFKMAKKERNIWKLTQKLLHHKQISILQESSRLRVVV